MKVKKIVMATALVGILSVNAQAGMFDIVGDIGGALTGGNAKSATSGDTNCIPRNGGGSTSLTQMVTKKVLELAINAALKEAVGDKNVKLPQKITDTCKADQVLKYTTTLSTQFDGDIQGAEKDILASLEQTKEIQHLQAGIDHKDSEVNMAEASVMVGDDKEAQDLIGKTKIKDKELYSKAMGKLAVATPINGYVLLGWDKEILEFAKDNIPWALKNVGAIKDVAGQLITTIKVVPALVNLVKSPHYDGRVDKDIADKSAKDDIKTKEEAASEAEGQW